MVKESLIREKQRNDDDEDDDEEEINNSNHTHTLTHHSHLALLFLSSHLLQSNLFLSIRFDCKEIRSSDIS